MFQALLNKTVDALWPCRASLLFKSAQACRESVDSGRLLLEGLLL
jgi:hypothetical protein